tara:strand:- start:402 stop:836 length:435 start_codon:yes stop_codon:yes gene_type:complete
MSREHLIKTFIEVSIDTETQDDFLKIRETLTRMGVSNKAQNTLFQSCHILHKQGVYYIVHFKELFALDGRNVTMTEEDYARRNTIAKILERWGMCKIVNEEQCESPILAGRNSLTIIPHSQKSEWNLSPKYQIGGKRKEEKSQS